MPRPKPPEELIIFNIRLTRTQIRKVKEMGGPAWLRELISKSQKTKHGLSSIDRIRNTKARNWAIGRSEKTSTELAALYKLSRQQINAIKREYAVDRHVAKSII